MRHALEREEPGIHDHRGARLLADARAARVAQVTRQGPCGCEQSAASAVDITEQASFAAHRILGLSLEGWTPTGHMAILELDGDSPDRPLVLGYDDAMRSGLQVGRVSDEGTWEHHAYVFSLPDIADAYESMLAVER